MKTTVVVQWDIHMQCGRHICSEAYVNNVKCMYTSACADIVDCTEFIWGICTDMVVSYAYKVFSIYGISMAFGGIFVVGTCMDIAWKVVVWCVF